ncbi:trypsin-like serine protease [Streptomyces sp. SID5770]|uniref:serine protease n=1 Tax=unclassified Streptomyces TaxID=2593676 RepID=UPI00136989B9|nr:serine protease [Streptomyces sp. SID5770]MZE53771.1 trypsin-like serine protease [Streptomyces sp. SID5770]MZE56540.1 trypsin-like serine protease [Streptomyces sp. SID5770]
MGWARKLVAAVAGVVMGASPLGIAPAYAVVGGQEARPHQYPFMAGLVDLAERRVMCGGALIGDRYVLTAAHCLTGSYGSTARVGVLLGDHDLTAGDDSPHALLASPARFLTHPEYDPETQRNDIALVRLAEPVAFSRDVRPVALPTAYAHGAFDHTRVEAPGWGATSFGGRASDVLRTVTLGTMNNRTCVARGMSRVTSAQLCTYAPGRDTCLYDSGGPLVHTAARKPHLVGLVSYGRGCAGDTPAVNTRVWSYLSWIGRVSGLPSRAS